MSLLPPRPGLQSDTQQACGGPATFVLFHLLHNANNVDTAFRRIRRVGACGYIGKLCF